MDKISQKYRRWWREHPQSSLIAIMAAVVIAQGLGMLSLSEALQTLLVFALVMVTWGYALETRKIAKATEEANSASLRPIIVMGRNPLVRQEPVRGEVFTPTEILGRTWLHNVGPGPAINLRFSIKEPNRANTVEHFSGSSITALGSGEACELVMKDVFGQIRGFSHDLLVEYEDVFGNKWCSGLELRHVSGDRFTVLNLFYEKMDDKSTTPQASG